MASKNHHSVKRIIGEIIKKYPSLSKIDTIKLNDPYSKNVLDYKPDYAIKKKLSEQTYYFIIFEVIEGQSDTKTLADMARIIGKQEIKKAIFLSCSPKKYRETDRIISVILGSYKDKFKKKNKKAVLNIVNREILNTDKERDIQKLILEELKPFLPK